MSSEITAKDLIDAAETGAVAELRRLLGTGIDVNARDDDGRTALLAALSEGCIEIAILLLDLGAASAIDSDGRGPLHHAVGSRQVAGLLLGLELAPNVEAPDNDGFTPLAWAALLDDLEALDLLLDRGADPDKADEDGWAPLHHAARKGHARIIRRLLARGAHLTRLSSGHSALDLARHYAPDSEACIVLAAAEVAREI